MPGAARQSVDFAAGAQIGVHQSFCYVEDRLWMVLGDVNAGHGFPPHSPPPPMVTASNVVFVNGIPACRAGHIAACGHPTTGSGVVFADE
jgi:uncharacterized Zn-binding protein involved in type VI secretion